MTGITQDVLRAELQSRIRSISSQVRELDAKLAALVEQVKNEKHRLAVIKDFYRAEFGEDSVVSSSEGQQPLLDVPPRFANMTVRQAVRIVLQENGPLHLSELHRKINEGGKKVAKPSVGSIVMRAPEFERVPNQPNTWKLKEEKKVA